MLFFSPGSCDSLLSRIKRQQASTSEPKKEESFEIEICKDKDAGEWFRLTAQDGDSCRDVIQCTSSVSKTQYIQILLFFSNEFYMNLFNFLVLKLY